MKWYWYVARDDELMMDLDGSVLLAIAQKRLERSSDQIGEYETFIAPSNSDDHFHLVVRLIVKMDILERQVWQLFFMDHVYRSVKNLFRAIEGVPAPSLLISPKRWSDGFWRRPDAVCRCKSHKDPERIKKCPAHIKLRGKS